MTKKEAVKALNELRDSVKDSRDADPETLHIQADAILLQYVPNEITKAYGEVDEACRGFWYA
jgi:hypothetical protein